MNPIDEAKERGKFEAVFGSGTWDSAPWMGQKAAWLAAKRQAREEFLSMLPDECGSDYADRFAPSTYSAQQVDAWQNGRNIYRDELLRRMGE